MCWCENSSDRLRAVAAVPAVDRHEDVGDKEARQHVEDRDAVFAIAHDAQVGALALQVRARTLVAG